MRHQREVNAVRSLVRHCENDYQDDYDCHYVPSQHLAKGP